jgi:hypothetical protein
MGTSGFRHVGQGRAVDGADRTPSSRVGHGLGLGAAALLLGFGCLNVLGDVEIDGIGTETKPNKAGGDMDCPDAGLAGGTCVVRCEPGATRCAENLLQRCNAAGDGWDSTDRCGSAALCDPVAAACTPPACRVSEYRCTESGALEVCGRDRTGFEFVRQCTSAAFCSAMPGREVCTDTPCRPGRERCNGAQIERCREDRSGYDVLGAPCASAALCVEAEAEAARCEPPVCVPGSFACEGALLSRCSDDANRFLMISDCGSPDRCLADQERCADVTCVAGTRRCMGNVLQRCSATQNGFEPIEVCATAALCDATVPACLTVTPPPPLDDLPDPAVLDGADYEFIDAASTAVLGLGPMELEVPEQWSSVDRNPWTDAAGTAIGPRLIASTDAARFARNFDIPGVYFAATEAAPVDVAARHQEFDLSSRCTAGGSEPYEDDLYAGTVRTYTNCGVTKATTVVVVAVDKDAARFVTVVIVTMTAERDDEARRVIWNSFVAD